MTCMYTMGRATAAADRDPVGLPAVLALAVLLAHTNPGAAKRRPAASVALLSAVRW